jgi:hypothetical protein
MLSKLRAVIVKSEKLVAEPVEISGTQTKGNVNFLKAATKQRLAKIEKNSSVLYFLQIIFKNTLPTVIEIALLLHKED